MLENRANYYHISKENVDIVPENGTKVARYFVNCFDRELVLLFNDNNLSEQDIVQIEKDLDKAYTEWHSVITDVPCEEYMISKLDRYYRNSIVAVLYVGDDEDE
jgi:hypothetical protein